MGLLNDSGLALRASGQNTYSSHRGNDLGPSTSGRIDEDIADLPEPLPARGSAAARDRSERQFRERLAEKSERHTLTYLGGHAPAGAGGAQPRAAAQRRPDASAQQHRPDREAAEGRRKLRSYKRRENELRQLLSRPFSSDFAEESSVKALIEQSVAKLLSVDKANMEHERAHGASPEILKRVVFCDNCVTVFQGLLPLTSREHWDLLR